MGAVGQRAYTAGNFGLDLEGMMAGWLVGWEGGMPTTEVVMEKLGPDHLQHKHISGVKYEDITLTVGTGMSKHFWQWVQDSFNRNYSRNNGAVVAANFDYKETSRLEFKEGLISQVTFPALDAASKDSAKVTVKVTPEYTRNTVTPMGGATVTFQGDRAKQIHWTPANFRLSIDGLDCSRVFKIEALTLNQKTQQYNIGELRDYQVEPTQVEYPNLVVTMPESHSSDFWGWYNDFVINGNCTESSEKSGTLEYLDPSLAMTLFQLDFTRLGVFKVTQDKAEANTEGIRRVKFEMYCESIKFTYSDAAVFA